MKWLARYSCARRGKGRIGRTAGLIGASESAHFVLDHAQTLVMQRCILSKSSTHASKFCIACVNPAVAGGWWWVTMKATLACARDEEAT